MTRIRYINNESCPPHDRWVYCEGCDEYLELYGVICHGEHTGLPACGTVKDCDRCRTVELKPCRCDHAPHQGQCPHPDGCWCDTFDPEGLPPQVRAEPDARECCSDEELAILKRMPKWATKGIKGLK